MTSSLTILKKREALGIKMTQFDWSRLASKYKRKIKERLMQDIGQNICHSCGCYVNGLTIDHVVPLRRGGKILDLNNMQLLCKKCHDRKTELENKEHDYSNRYSNIYITL